jgi:signal transduction histidine kinase
MESLPQNRLNSDVPEDRPARPAILIVDDREDNLLSLSRFLEPTGALVIKANNGNDALKACLNHEFALALLDVNMPGMDGYELAELMRGGKDHSAVPIIFVTAAYRQEEQIFKGYSAGAVDYLVKPLRPEILLNKVNVFLDIHRQKQEIAQLNTALAAHAAELEAANLELESFNRTVSHDLRGPVRIIANFCQLIAGKYDHSLDEKFRRYFQTIHKEALRMDKLITVLLGFSRLSRQEMQLQEVDLSEMARVISHELQPTDQGRRVEFFIADQLSCHGDQDLLRVALSNLLGNAWKYSSKEALSTIEVGALNRDDQAPTFYVRDNGVGFNQNYADKLFRLFQRLHSSDDFEGHGIGLITVQRIIHRHGGRVWAESEEGEGATFYFTLKGRQQGDVV